MRVLSNMSFIVVLLWLCAAMAAHDVSDGVHLLRRSSRATESMDGMQNDFAAHAMFDEMLQPIELEPAMCRIRGNLKSINRNRKAKKLRLKCCQPGRRVTLRPNEPLEIACEAETPPPPPLPHPKAALPVATHRHFGSEDRSRSLTMPQYLPFSPHGSQHSRLVPRSSTESSLPGHLQFVRRPSTVSSLSGHSQLSRRTSTSTESLLGHSPFAPRSSTGSSLSAPIQTHEDDTHGRVNSEVQPRRRPARPDRVRRAHRDRDQFRAGRVHVYNGAPMTAAELAASRERPEIGLNIFDPDRGQILRIIQRDDLTNRRIPTNFLNPTHNILIYCHGWQRGWDGNHYWLNDQWQRGDCAAEANAENIEACPPPEYNAAIWKQHGWDVIFLDWAFYAQRADLTELVPYQAESAIYDEHVITHLTNLLQDVLRLAGWDGEELRITGNSLGTQVALGMAANFRSELAYATYRDKVKRIVLFDHFITNLGTPRALRGVSTCAHINQVVLPAIRSGDDRSTWPVIENYRTSALTSNKATGCSNPTLNRHSVFVEFAPDYYSTILDQPLRHTVGISMYLHCMKWVGVEHAQENVPSCRMSADALREACGADQNGNCQFWFRQSAGFTTTWDMDDTYDLVRWSVMEPPVRWV